MEWVGTSYLRPGITLPYDDKTSHFPGANKSKHREYKPGPMVNHFPEDISGADLCLVPVPCIKKTNTT